MTCGKRTDSLILTHPNTYTGTTTVAAGQLLVNNTSGSATSLAEARVLHTATLLRTGEVLAAGGAGSDQTSLASAELYQPTTGTWTTAPTQLHSPRHGHSAVGLQDGSVLIAAGVDHTVTGGDTYLRTAEEYTRR